ncbi:MAG: hypothetical protein AAB225_15400 [Acidobacteriota bacterium]
MRAVRLVPALAITIACAFAEDRLPSYCGVVGAARYGVDPIPKDGPPTAVRDQHRDRRWID